MAAPHNGLPARVRELAVKTVVPVRVPVVVRCRVLKIARQPYYRWLAGPISDRDW